MTSPVDTFLWYLNEIRGARYYCPYCSYDSFTTIAGDQAKGLGDINSEFYGVSCSRCGHTALFSVEIVRESARKEAEGRGQPPAPHEAAEPSPISQLIRRRLSAT